MSTMNITPLDKQQKDDKKNIFLEFHRIFFKIFHLPIDWITPDDRSFTVCGMLNCNQLCIRMQQSKKGAECCAAVDTQRLNEARRMRSIIVSKCKLELYDAIVPIFLRDRYMGSFCIGQYLTSNQITMEKVKKIRKEFPFLANSDEELYEMYKKTKVLTAEEEEGLVELVQRLSIMLCESNNGLEFLKSFTYDDPIKMAELYITQNYTQPLTLDGIARSINLSKSHFLHKFKAQAGVSPMVYLNLQRIKAAQKMLVETKLNITTVAYSCGFNNIQNFNRQFLNITGISPSEYRKKNRTDS